VEFSFGSLGGKKGSGEGKSESGSEESVASGSESDSGSASDSGSSDEGSSGSGSSDDSASDDSASDDSASDDSSYFEEMAFAFEEMHFGSLGGKKGSGEASGKESLSSSGGIEGAVKKAHEEDGKKTSFLRMRQMKNFLPGRAFKEFFESTGMKFEMDTQEDTPTTQDNQPGFLHRIVAFTIDYIL